MQVQTIPLNQEAVDNALLINAVYIEMERQGWQPSVLRLWRVLRILAPWWRWR